MKRLFNILLILLLLLSFTACANKANDNAATVESTSESTVEPSASSDSEELKVIYEGIFLNNDEILKIFEEIRGDAPLETVTKDFHVTTEFMPSEDHRQWYSEKLKVHISAYKLGDVKMDDGNMTTNEGLKVEITSDNSELNDYLNSLGKNFHITGAYKDGAKYTEYIDFSDAKEVDYTVEGTFGGYFSDGSFIFDSNDLNG